MSESSDLYHRLSERFESHYTRQGGGNTDLVYITGEQVISRLNAVLGPDGWEFEVQETAVSTEADEIAVRGRMVAYFPLRAVAREQWGSQKIKRTREGKPIEIGMDYKGATTDALKKCATLLGVGLYLSDKEELAEVKLEMAQERRNGARPVPQPAPSNGTGRPVAAAPGPRTPTPVLSVEVPRLDEPLSEAAQHLRGDLPAEKPAIIPQVLFTGNGTEKAATLIAACREHCDLSQDEALGLLGGSLGAWLKANPNYGFYDAFKYIYRHIHFDEPVPGLPPLAPVS